jgi:NAD(P)H-flavin reductase
MFDRVWPPDPFAIAMIAYSSMKARARFVAVRGPYWNGITIVETPERYIILCGSTGCRPIKKP